MRLAALQLISRKGSTLTHKDSRIRLSTEASTRTSMSTSTVTALGLSLSLLALIGFIAQIRILSHSGTGFKGSLTARLLAIERLPIYGKEFSFRNASNKPCHHVYFLKMHKSASTTIQRIILMYGLKHNLTFALPLKDSNAFAPMPFHPDITKRTATHPFFDIMAVHSRFTTDAAKYMPNDTVFISIVRDPADQLDSAFHYYFKDECKLGAGIDIHLDNGLFCHNIPTCNPNLGPNCNMRLLRNMQLYDFGVKLTPDATVEIVEREMYRIEKRFHLVLIMEMLDEGLILMRDLLNWDTEDILYFKMNYRLNPNNVSENTRRKAYEYNWADTIMYDFFRAKMVAMIAKQPEYIKVQVEEFSRLQEALFNFCIDSVQPRGNRTDATSLLKLTLGGSNNDTCRLMSMIERSLIVHINTLRPEVSDISDIHRTLT